MGTPRTGNVVIFGRMNYAKRLLWKCLYLAQHLLIFRCPRLTVLLYHSVSDTHDFFSVLPEEFRAQMTYIRQHYAVVGASEVAAYLQGTPLKKDSVMITFDDGYCDIADTAGPILKELGIPSTVFVLAGDVDRTELGNSSPLLDVADMTRLGEYGITVGSHGCSHKKLTRLSEQEARKEIEESRARIGAYMATPTTFAYPKGAYNPHVATCVHSAGYTLAFTAQARAVRRGDNPYAIPRVQIDATTDMATFKAKLSLAQDWYYAAWLLFRSS